jgi:repressor LexA
MKLTEKQRAVLKFIQHHISAHGYPPTIREICTHFGFSSPLSAQQHIEALRRKGYIKKHPSKQRSIEVANIRAACSTRLPLVGKIRAGEPILAAEEIEEYITVDASVFNGENGFALKVIGDSMIEAGIFEGDIVFVDPDKEVRNGDIVIALIGDDEATIKKFYRKGDVIRLVPENSKMEPLVVKSSDITIIGKAMGILRRL